MKLRIYAAGIVFRFRFNSKIQFESALDFSLSSYGKVSFYCRPKGLTNQRLHCLLTRESTGQIEISLSLSKSIHIRTIQKLIWFFNYTFTLSRALQLSNVNEFFFSIVIITIGEQQHLFPLPLIWVEFEMRKKIINFFLLMMAYLAALFFFFSLSSNKRCWV